MTDLTLSAMEDWGMRLGAALRPGDVVALSGGLGAGKTTLARAMLRGLGFADDVPSPTFAIVQPYDPPAVRIAVIHADLYRLEAPEEVEELGLWDGLGEGALIVEWPERLPDRVWASALRVRIDGSGEATRRLTVAQPLDWERRCPLPRP